MADVIITLKIMPESPETDINSLKAKVIAIITEEKGEVGKEEIEPVAFGLNAIKLIFVRDEKLGGADAIEQKVRELEGVASAEVIDVRRAIG
ncbi:MAG: elongation factor 1-beta [Candidatus Nanoarchaeia archaeon]